MKKEKNTNNHSNNTNNTNKIKATKANVVARPSRLPSRPARFALHCIALHCIAGRPARRGFYFCVLSCLFFFLQRGNPQTPFSRPPFSPTRHPCAPPPPHQPPTKEAKAFFSPFLDFFFLPSLACLSSQGVEDSWKEQAGGGVQPASRAEPSRAELSRAEERRGEERSQSPPSRAESSGAEESSLQPSEPARGPGGRLWRWTSSRG